MTYLGVAIGGFPNFYTVTGPQSPSVLSNMMVSIEQHVDWIADCMAYLREHGYSHDRGDARRRRPAGSSTRNELGEADAVPAGQLVVHGRQRARQAAGVPALHRRRAGRTARSATRSPPTATKDSSWPDPGHAARATDRPHDTKETRNMPLDPIAAGLLQQMEEAGMPPLNEMSPGRRPRRRRGLPRPRRRTRGRRRRPRPHDPRPGRRHPGPHLHAAPATARSACLVYYHGGGWVLGDIEGLDTICRALANRAAAWSCRSSTGSPRSTSSRRRSTTATPRSKWVAANAASLDVDAAELAVGGDSAGGNLGGGGGAAGPGRGRAGAAAAAARLPGDEPRLRHRVVHGRTATATC